MRLLPGSCRDARGERLPAAEDLAVKLSRRQAAFAQAGEQSGEERLGSAEIVIGLRRQMQRFAEGSIEMAGAIEIAAVLRG